MKQRVISAVIALLIAIPLVLLGGIYFNLFALIIGILGLKEILKAKGNIPIYMEYISYILFCLFMIVGIVSLNDGFSLNLDMVLLSFLLLFLPLIMYNDSKKYSIEDAFYLLSSVLFLATSFNLLVLVRSMSLYLFIYLFLITIITDTFAYIGGSKFGKNKLAPMISPNKSVEGFVIGLVFGSLIASLFYYFVIGNINYVLLFLLTIILSIVGQFGDLVFSAIKRHFKVKDFSNIMPGHGGILDRLDSIIFVLITFIILIRYF